MDDRLPAGAVAERPSGSGAAALPRIAVIDTDSGFLQVLTKRLERLSWEHRVLATPVPVETLIAMRLSAVVIDLGALGPHGWEYLEKLTAGLPGLGVVVCTGQSTVAQRVRGLRRLHRGVTGAESDDKDAAGHRVRCRPGTSTKEKYGAGPSG